MTAQIRWGILGTASIAMKRLVPAIHRARNARLVAIASRNTERAALAARLAEAPHHCGYQELLERDDIDAVYIPLPNHLHGPWTVKSVEAGKHVLCEKPFTLNAAEAERVIASVERFPAVKVMEAFMYRFHPQWLQIQQVIRDGGIGEVASAHTHFTFHNIDPHDILNHPEWGGGALLDIGCYGISVARFAFGQEPVAVQGTMLLDQEFGVDKLTSGVLTFEEGLATFTAGTQLPWQQSVLIGGSAGHIEIVRPFNPLPDEIATFRVTTGAGVNLVEVPPADQYALMVEEFSRAVLDNLPVPTPLDDARGNMRVISDVKLASVLPN